MLDKIQSFYGFTRMPYGRNLAPGMLHQYADHAQAAARIAYGINTSGITVITGEVGVGKTVAARAALDRADRARHHLIYIPDPTVGARGVFHHIVTALGGRPSFHTATLVPQARDALAAELSERGRTPVLLIDEAHLFGHDALEAIRLLTSADMDSATSCSVLLVGQPTLARQLRMGVFAALDQRIATRYHITPMDLGESADYLRHHLALVGRTDPLFADDAIARLHKASLGLPRAFNNAATAALIASTSSSRSAAGSGANWRLRKWRPRNEPRHRFFRL